MKAAQAKPQPKGGTALRHGPGMLPNPTWREWRDRPGTILLWLSRPNPNNGLFGWLAAAVAGAG